MRRMLVLLYVLMGVSVSSATVVHVPSDQPTIQAGVNAAVNGDTILVAPGTYTGDDNRDILVSGKQLVIMSSGGADSTIINCDGGWYEKHGGFYIENQETSGSLIHGFTIMGVYSDEYEWWQALYLNDTQVDVEDCIFTNNDCASSYGTARCVNSTAHFLDCRFINNHCIGNVAMSIEGGSNILIENCLISHNVSGGDNSGIGVSNSILTIQHSTLAYNDMPGMGGAQALEASNSDVSVNNSIIAYNSGYYSSGWLWLDELSTVSLNHCDIYGNEFGDWVEPIEDQLYINGNMECDPRFCNPYANFFYLDVESCCIGSGEDGSDIGAFGVGCQWNCGNADATGVVDIDDVVYLIAYVFQGGPEPIPLESGNVDCEGVIDIDDIVYLIQYIFQSGNPPCDPDGNGTPDCGL